MTNNNKTVKLPLKHKKEIQQFIKEYSELSRRRKIKIKVTSEHENRLQKYIERNAGLKGIKIQLPEQYIVVDVIWDSDWTVTILRGMCLCDYLGDLHKSPEIKDCDKQIQNFCQRVSKFGKIFFGDEDWLWDELFGECSTDYSKVYIPKIKWD